MESETKLNRLQRWRRVALVLLIGLAALIVWLGLTSTGHAVVRAGLLVLDILPQSPISPLRVFTPEPVVEQVRFSYEGGTTEGRVFRPSGEGPHSAAILSLGYGPDPDDPLVLQVSEDLARVGIVVLIPNTLGLHMGNLMPEEVEVLVGAFEYLAAQSYVKPDRIGYAGFCVGSSIALVAAEDPRINEQVSYVNVFGGYYDARDLIRAVAARSSRYEGQEFAWTPHQQTAILFVQNVLLHLDVPQERQTLRQLIQTPPEDPTALLAELTPLGRLGYSSVTGSDPATVDALLATIPEQISAELKLISPSTGIDRLEAKVFIMHDVSDPYVPVTESYRLADAIPNAEQKVYAQFTLFDHVRPSRSMNWLHLLREAIKLFVYLCRVMIYVTA
jgi:dienelactone hydrolase